MITKKIEVPDTIELEYLNNNNKYITKRLGKGNRRILTTLYFSCIELFEKDEIENFLIISEKHFKSNYEKNTNIVLFQYLEYSSDKIYCSVGKIINADKEEFTYDIQSYDGGIGAPIVICCEYNYNDKYLVGINIEKQTNSGTITAKNVNFILRRIKEELSLCHIF